MITRQKVLFLCTGNSCRSQMAEGFLRQMAGERFEAHSAGVEPSGEVNPLAVKVMAEVGIDISGTKPKDVSVYLGWERISWLIIVCDHARQTCPRVWPMLADEKRLYWPLPDPADAEGAEERVLAVFREIRDDIQRRLKEWLDSLPDILGPSNGNGR